MYNIYVKVNKQESFFGGRLKECGSCILHGRLSRTEIDESVSMLAEPVRASDKTSLPLFYMGAWSNGKIIVFKTTDEGSIPSAPANF